VRDSFGQLEHLSSIVFVLDRRFQIVYCNEAWDRFAESNGAVQLKRPAPYGVCVLDGVPGFLKNLYRSAYLNAFEYGQAWQFPYECSSDAIYRLFRMTVQRMSDADFLVVTNSLLEERTRGREWQPIPPNPDLYGGFGVPIAMCSLCRRTRRLDARGWDWVPDYVASPPTAVSYAICDDCTGKIRSHTTPDPAAT
jgi:hypothetical protein